VDQSIESQSESNPRFQYNVLLLEQIYTLEKSHLGTRSKNALTAQEEKHGFNSNLEQKQYFFQKHFIEQFDFLQLANIGITTALELRRFSELIREFIRCSLENSLDPKDVLLQKQLSALFANEIEADQIKLLIAGSEFYLFRTACVLLKRASISKTKHRILEQLWFIENPGSAKEIARKVGCSYELVRISIDSFRDEILPSVVREIRARITTKSVDAEFSTDVLFLDLQSISHFAFNESLYTPNLELSKALHKVALSENFIVADELLQELSPPGARCFNSKNRNLLLNKAAIERLDCKHLLEFLDREIYNFEKLQFDYDLRVLIKRFYKENTHQDIEKHELNALYELIEKIKKDAPLVDIRNRKKTEKKEKTNRILEIAEKVILSNGSPMKTNDILQAVHGYNIEVDTQQLLHKLGRCKEIFTRLGNSFWGLKEYHQIDHLTGSLREIVQDILLSHHEPIHITELAEIISKMRPISIKSLATNLKLAESKSFVFFNCSFVGLASKKYAGYWDEIRRFIPARLTTELAKYKSTPDPEVVANRMFELYGYPKIHTKYILSIRNGASTVNPDDV